MMHDIGRLYRGTPALWERDTSPEGFHWIDAGNADQNVLSFLRFDANGGPLVCVANLSPEVHHHYRVGLPHGGRWIEALNTDSDYYGGSGVGNLGAVTADDRGWHGQGNSAPMTLPPLAVLWLKPEEA
jgi:1,4-alpha-glucan branching enzyme